VTIQITHDLIMCILPYLMVAEDRSANRQIGSEPDDNVGFKVGCFSNMNAACPASLNICNWLLLFAESRQSF